MARVSSKSRKTKETEIQLTLNIDGQGKANIESGIAFLDHMLELLAKQSSFDLEVKASGDLQVDLHHTVEDIGLVFGEALNEALGKKENIERYAQTMLPMDEALVMVAVDVSGRPYLSYDVDLAKEEIGGFNVDLVADFLQAFVSKAGITLHMRLLAGRNTHHIIEAVFKGLGRTLGLAVKQSRKGVPSTKGTL